MDANAAQISLQDLVESQPSLVEYFRNDTLSPHTRNRSTLSPIPAEFTNWRDEQRAWRETAILFDQTHHMPELFIDGPDASKLLTKLGVNSFATLSPGRARQFVCCNEDGYMIGESILYCNGKDAYELVSGMQAHNWIHYNAKVGKFDVKLRRDPPTSENSGKRTKFRFQLDGPNAAAIFGELVEGGAPDIPFFNTAKLRIAGCEVVVLRHGMAGHKGVEISGPIDDYDKVRDAILGIGKKYGIKLGGSTAYFSSVLEGGWMAYPVPAVFTGELMKSYRQWLPADSWEGKTQLGGSLVTRNIEDYYVTPYDMGYSRLPKFDHDFVGRAALEKLEKTHTRTSISLIWNDDDVAAVFRSYQQKDDLPYKYINMPVSHYAFQQADEVRSASGELVGKAVNSGYSINERKFWSSAIVNLDYAKEGTELIVTWGEPNGGSRKPHVERHRQFKMRVTVAPKPFPESVRKQKTADIVTGAKK